jgi:hypothetical protein
MQPNVPRQGKYSTGHGNGINRYGISLPGHDDISACGLGKYISGHNTSPHGHGKCAYDMIKVPKEMENVPHGMVKYLWTW